MSVGGLQAEASFAVRYRVFLSEREQAVMREMKVFMTRWIFIDSIFVHVIRRFLIDEIAHWTKPKIFCAIVRWSSAEDEQTTPTTSTDASFHNFTSIGLHVEIDNACLRESFMIFYKIHRSHLSIRIDRWPFSRIPPFISQCCIVSNASEDHGDLDREKATRLYRTMKKWWELTSTWPMFFFNDSTQEMFGRGYVQCACWHPLRLGSWGVSTSHVSSKKNSVVSGSIEFGGHWFSDIQSKPVRWRIKNGSIGRLKFSDIEPVTLARRSSASANDSTSVINTLWNVYSRT